MQNEAEIELSQLRKMAPENLFREYYRGSIKKRKKVYAGSELYKQHMKGKR